MRRLFVSWLPGETRAALKHDDRLVDLLVLREDRPSTFGNIYLGRVTAFHKGLDAAFVDLGAGPPGLLARADAGDQALNEGAGVLVRVVREAFDDKGPRLRRLDRRAAGAFEPAAGAARAPAFLGCDRDRLRDLACREPVAEEIWVDQAEAVVRMKAETFAERPDLAARVKWSPLGIDLFEQEGLETEIDALLEPRVDLPSGGYLLIEPVRSMTPVDVNSGRYQRARQALVTDQEAAEEIPRQLRLRSLSGLVVIDFLELKDPKQRAGIVQRLRDVLGADPVASRVCAMRPSGLVELTRRRIQSSLQEVMTDPCGLGGNGRTTSPATLAYQALRALQREAARNPGAAPSLRAHPAIAAALGGTVKPALAYLEERLGRPVAVVPREGSDSVGFEVMLGSRP